MSTAGFFWKPLAGMVLLASLYSCSSTKNIAGYKIDRKSGDLETRLIMSSIKNKIAITSDSLARAKMLETLSGYKPEIKSLSEKVRVVDGDTLLFSDYNYPVSDFSNTATMAHNKIVGENALRIIPESRPYINMTINACNRHKGKFPVPPESMLALFYAESDFYPYALSGARAWGIAQFLWGTAKAFGLDVYSPEKFPTLYRLEKKAESLTKNYYAFKNLVNQNLKSHNFDAVKRYTLISDSLRLELVITRDEFSDEIMRIGIKNIDDDRLVPEKIIPVATEYVAGLADKAKREYHCSDEQAIDWAMEAYNGGYGNLKKELPFVETYNHERRINKIESRLYPRYSRSPDYEFYDLNLPTVIQNSKPEAVHHNYSGLSAVDSAHIVK